MPKDQSGKEIHIGDYLAFACGSRYSRLEFGRVHHFTKTGQMSVAQGWLRQVRWAKDGTQLDVHEWEPSLKPVRDSGKTIVIGRAQIPPSDLPGIDLTMKDIEGLDRKCMMCEKPCTDAQGVPLEDAFETQCGAEVWEFCPVCGSILRGEILGLLPTKA